jgi:hypothetical protein
MRIFQTAPQGTPRISPGMTVEEHYVPEGVSYSNIRRDEAFGIDNSSRLNSTSLHGLLLTTSAFGTNPILSDPSDGLIRSVLTINQGVNHSLLALGSVLGN